MVSSAETHCAHGICHLHSVTPVDVRRHGHADGGAHRQPPTHYCVPPTGPPPTTLPSPLFSPLLQPHVMLTPLPHSPQPPTRPGSPAAARRARGRRGPDPDADHVQRHARARRRRQAAESATSAAIRHIRPIRLSGPEAAQAATGDRIRSSRIIRAIINVVCACVRFARAVVLGRRGGNVAPPAEQSGR